MTREISFNNGELFWMACLQAIYLLILLIISKQAVLQKKRRVAYGGKLKEAFAARLTSFAVIVQENEIERIGQDFHDDLSCLLVSLQHAVSALECHCVENTKQETLKKNCILLIVNMSHRIRMITRQLYPFDLREQGLSGSIDSLAKILCCTDEIKVHLFNQAEETLAVLPDQTMLAIFRILQELLTNTIRHALAYTIIIGFHIEGSRLVIYYEDDGKGMDPNKMSKGFGLSGISKRVQMIGGTESLTSSPDEGIKFQVHIPVPGN